MPDAQCAARLSRDLVLRTGPGAADGALQAVLIGGLEVAIAAGGDAPDDLRSLLRQGPTRLDAMGRAQIGSFVAPLAARPGSDASGLRAALRLVRDALRERLPVQPWRLRIDALVAAAPPMYVLLADGPAARGPLTAVSPEGARVPLDASERPITFELAALGAEGWVIEGEDFEVWAPPAIERPAAAWAALLAGGGDDAIARLAPALEALERRISSEASVTAVSDHGPPGGDARVSIVVALHHRLDLLEHQLAAFAADPEARAAELVYVIDGAGIAQPATAAVPALADLYRMRVRLVVLGAPAGRAVALDAGASQAAGRLLAFMCGDVLPEGAGWLSTLAAAGSPAAPALADEHGMRFATPPADEPCLIVRADAFQEAGGFGARYPGGVGAGADLVRRLDDHGHALRRADEVVLRWLGGVDAPTITPEARRYGAWLRAQERARCAIA
jgi:hypothetical protein